MADEAGDEDEETASAEATASRAEQYWLRVHGYPADLKSLGADLVYYEDFFDPRVGVLPGDPRLHLRLGDVIIFYADGPASLYGVGRVAGEVEGPFSELREGYRWRVPIAPEALIAAIAKAPHAAALSPPSGWHFLSVVRDYTFIRLPEEDGRYLVGEVRSRASTRGE